MYGCTPIEPPPERLTERHILERIPAKGKKARPKIYRVVCIKRGQRREYIYWCSECEAGMRLDGCFKSYHANLNF
jgi:hypothetical protein